MAFRGKAKNHWKIYTPTLQPLWLSSCTSNSKPAQTDWYTKITLAFLVKDTEGALAVRKAKYAASNSNSYHCANKKLNNILLHCGAN